MGYPEELFGRLTDGGYTELERTWKEAWTETLFLDFKRSSDNGAGTKLHAKDRDRLGKAVSGFANSDGGVLVWGINCSKNSNGEDAADTPIPVVNPARFAGWLEEATASVSIPQHRSIRHRAIEDPTQPGQGFVVSLIPAGDFVPYRNVTGKFDHCAYFIRAGNSFVPTPHGVLAGMFGRRPPPNILLRFLTGRIRKLHDGHIDFGTNFALRNASSVVAVRVYCNLWIESCPTAVKLSLSCPTHALWRHTELLGFHYSALALPGTEVAPEGFLSPWTVHFEMGPPPFDKDLKLRFAYGAEGAPMKRGEMFVSAANLDAIFSRMQKRLAGPKFIEKGDAEDDDISWLETREV